MSFLLDTNIVSLAIKNDFYIKQKLEVMKFEEVDIYISCITYFEVRRGFLAVDAPKKRERFNQLCQKYSILFLDDLAILEKAAEIHANLRLKGLPIQSEDVLIAATAMIKGLTVVSNDSDLTRVEGLILLKVTI
ncbi:PIN domain-containing protein [Cronbergia sp. UHCC 0137]|uniref:PIN domain-containing protein n=1 Tax=Cronbergia sp. UHCC 0137 TaxID=3110239 RepID=UPI002B215BB5|nr:PIN domain-containing protein [Cronbergia sp. UHCC 0137]MEA5616768.1 PIN domain-containing protein [Cronbergia sp. UHCC 0137]